jgi:dipeptidyl aminopeptidase/acylaminoacyl peptidase
LNITLGLNIDQYSLNSTFLDQKTTFFREFFLFLLLNYKIKLYLLIVCFLYIMPYTITSTAEHSIIQHASSLIPRKVIFGSPEKTLASVSPDGSKIAFIAPLNKILNIWITDSEDSKLRFIKPITQEDKQSIEDYYWAYNNKHILYLQDKNGNEEFHIYSLDLETFHIRGLTPFSNVRARILKLSHTRPNEILVAINKHNSQWYDIYLLNIINGQLTLLEKNQKFIDFISDNNLELRLALEDNQGNYTFYIKDSIGQWISHEIVTFEDELLTRYVSINKDNNIAYKIDSKNRDTAAIYSVNLMTKQQTLIAENNYSDCIDLLMHPYDQVPQAYSHEYIKIEWEILDNRIKEDFLYLKNFFSSNFEVVSRSLSDSKWIIRYYSDTNPCVYYLYNRDPINNQPLNLKFLFTTKNSVINLPLAPMYPLIIKARDGLNLVSYLTLPLDSMLADPSVDFNITLNNPVPLILFVHGGPWARDSWGINPYHQWLANRGYAVLSVNYRGSTGFGQKFINAGNKEWGRKMQYDLIDAVNWAIEHNIADREKIAILGYSYGGYAALSALTFFPDMFCCGISINGPSDLLTFITRIPLYWSSTIRMLKQRIGDPDTKEGKELLLSQSPAQHVASINKPLLIIQGQNDPRVSKTETDIFVNKIIQNNFPICYVVYHDEGHGITKESNSLSSHMLIETFLTNNLGGEYEDTSNEFNEASCSLYISSSYQKILGLSKNMDHGCNIFNDAFIKNMSFKEPLKNFVLDNQVGYCKKNNTFEKTTLETEKCLSNP